jgi:hypothetical protein
MRVFRSLIAIGGIHKAADQILTLARTQSRQGIRCQSQQYPRLDAEISARISQSRSPSQSLLLSRGWARMARILQQIIAQISVENVGMLHPEIGVKVK